jgi:hypothetical protein
MLRDYVAERKRQIDQCSAPEVCGVLFRLYDELGDK